MKTKRLAIPALLFTPVLFVACENPADKTVSATVSEAVEETSAPAGEGTRYVFTESSEIHFTGSKVTGSHSGGFKTFSGHFTIKDGAAAGGDHKVTIDLNSVWSDDERLTGHLKSADFFDVEKYPESTFTATSITPSSDSSYSVSGNLNLHGVTKNITFPATVTREGDTLKINATFDINRKDFGIVYAGKADDLIRDEVVIELKLEAKPGA